MLDFGYGVSKGVFAGFKIAIILCIIALSMVMCNGYQNGKEPIAVNGTVVDKFEQFHYTDFIVVVVTDDGEVLKIHDAGLYAEYEIGDRIEIVTTEGRVDHIW